MVRYAEAVGELEGGERRGAAQTRETRVVEAGVGEDICDGFCAGCDACGADDAGAVAVAVQIEGHGWLCNDLICVGG